MNLEKVFSKFSQIETERLLLRELRAEDSEEIYKIFSDEDVMQYYSFEPIKEKEIAEKIINSMIKSFEEKKAIRWAITIKGEDTVIGTCGYHNLQPRHFRSEIGYELSKEYWRKGIMKEALDAIINFGYDEMDLERIEALCEPENEASIGVLKKIGFSEEGVLRKYAFCKNQFQDLKMLSLLKEEFKK